jgi:predicted Zn-dependent peptidase
MAKPKPVRKRLARALTPAFLALLAPMLWPVSVLPADGDLSTRTLANGLAVYVYEKHTAPVASIHVWYRTGALNERPGIRGLSHLFEHMMFRGSENFGPNEHDERIYEMGGWSNAMTSDDYTFYFQTVPASGVETVMEMEADRMARLKLNEDILKTEIEVVKEEYRVRYENDPSGRLLRKLCEEYYGEHPYAWGAIGVMEDLEKVTVDDCLAYYRSRYAPNQASLIVVGNVDPDRVFAMAERHFGPIPRGPDPEADPAPPAKGPDLIRVREDIPVFLTSVAYRLPPAGHDDLVALSVLASLLGSRIDSLLTRDEKICVYADAMYDQQKQMSLVFFVGAHLPNVSANRVREAIEAAIEDYMENRLSESELQRIRNQELLTERTKRYSANGLASGMGYALTVEHDLDAYWGKPARIAALETEDLVRVWKRHFTPENRVDALVEPENPSRLLYMVGWFKSLLRL